MTRQSKDNWPSGSLKHSYGFCQLVVQRFVEYHIPEQSTRGSFVSLGAGPGRVVGQELAQEQLAQV